MKQSSEKGGDANQGPRPASRRRTAWSAPRLHVGQGGERQTTWLELFFDLVFVVAIATLAVFLHDHLTLGGFTVAACLWWLYFDHVDEEAIDQSFTSDVAGVVRSHVWGYGHLAVWGGIATASVGGKFVISEASEPELAAAIR